MKDFARILIVLSFVWILSRTAVYLLPGNPAEFLVHESLVQVSEETLKEKMDLNQPVWNRVFSFPKNQSLVRKETAFDLISNAAAKSFVLTLITLTFTFFITCSLLYLSFARAGGKSVSHFIAILLASLPLFVAGPLLLRFLHLPNPVLPALALSFYLSSFWFRTLQKKLDLYTPHSSADGARARGKSEFVIFFKDLVTPILGSFFLYFGTQIGILLNGSLMVEVIFQWNGIGSLLMDSVLSRDYPVIELCLLVVTLFTLMSQQLGYILQRILEPKLR